jgi:exodeoxyribonuclease V alpha subunit
VAVSEQQASLEGTLDQILYVREETGYVVARLEYEDPGRGIQSVTIVGKLLGVEVGMMVRLSGRYENHPRFGPQFQVDDFEPLKPANLVALERYLGSGQIKGVGPALAHRMAEHFGDQLSEVLDKEPYRLREVHGLGPVTVRQITAAWQDRSGLRELMVFLRGHGIAAAHARRIHKVYGAQSLDVIKRDPYLLARTVRGIGFRTADSVAEQLGIPRNSIERARAAVLYLLDRMADDGHVYAPLGYLENQFSTALDMDPDLVREAVSQLRESGELIVEKTDHPEVGFGIRNQGDQTAIYPCRLHEAEKKVAERLHLLTRARPMGKAAVERGLAAAEKLQQITLSPEQKAALRCALESKVAVITGGPGTGKTTLLRSLLTALDDAGIKPALAAPTGRAARRLAETTGREAKTIHRLLEYSPDTGQFLRGEFVPLRTSFLIIDEASMMDIELAASLVAALNPNCSLILVGDKDQLPSVGPGCVLKDIIASGLVPVIELKQVYRQAAKSMIVANAHRINRGLLPETGNESSGDFFFIERSAPEDVVSTIKHLVSTRLIGNFGITNANAIQVITPMNRGPLGVHLLNQELQQLLNPKGKELRAGERNFRIGDRVIQLRNNYEKLIFNGEIGRIRSIDSERSRLEVSFEEGVASYDLGEMDELALAYAISVHKSQGSQYPAVVMPLHQSHYLMLRRNLLYTAITRAERVCVLVGTRSALQQAVRNEEERRRYSRLAERLHID